MKESEIDSIVALERFIEAARDAGYKDITSALAELIDNAFEANARRVEIGIENSKNGEIIVKTSDNGCGMKPSVLQKALQFGGSTRFNSRCNSGRFGMGLPNSSISQARRVEVITWRKPESIWSSYLDVDEIASGKLKTVPRPKKAKYTNAETKSGTIVIWTKCDRIEIKNEKRFLTKIHRSLGRLFRKYLWEGKEIILCGEKVSPFDPLYLRGELLEKSVPFGPKLEYEITIPNTEKNTSIVSVQFVELPIDRWHSLSNEQKQSRGITKNAGVSIIRANREIDYGWFFTGKKRKENYDDWWRCEICFMPELDELFGVTNTKQGIRPTEYLKNILSPDIERIANSLNSRVRTGYAKVKSAPTELISAKIAAARDHLLEPPKKVFDVSDNISLYNLRPDKEPRTNKVDFVRGLKFRLETRKIEERSFYIPLLAAKEITVLLNENHPFYQCVFSPSVRLSNPEARLLHQYLELTLFAVARAECTITPEDDQNVIKAMREEWSKVLATFLE